MTFSYHESFTYIHKALKQIKGKNYHEKFKQQGLAIYIIGVEFNKTDRSITGFEWEKI